MSYTSYQTVNSLDEFTLIGGTYFSMEFDIFDADGGAMDVTGAAAAWVASYYGQPTNIIISKNATQTDTSTFTVTLDPSDTLTIKGKFAHQLIVTDVDGNEFRPGQGVFIIVPAINNI